MSPHPSSLSWSQMGLDYVTGKSCCSSQNLVINLYFFTLLGFDSFTSLTRWGCFSISTQISLNIFLLLFHNRSQLFEDFTHVFLEVPGSSPWPELLTTPLSQTLSCTICNRVFAIADDQLPPPTYCLLQLQSSQAVDLWYAKIVLCFLQVPASELVYKCLFLLRLQTQSMGLNSG